MCTSCLTFRKDEFLSFQRRRAFAFPSKTPVTNQGRQPRQGFPTFTGKLGGWERGSNFWSWLCRASSCKTQRGVRSCCNPESLGDHRSQGIGIVCRLGRRAWWMSMERVHHLSVALVTIQASVLDFLYMYSLSLSSSPWSRSGNGTPWPCLLPLHTLSSFNRITQAGRQAHRSPFPKTFFLFLYLHSFHNLGFGARLWTYRK